MPIKGTITAKVTCEKCGHEEDVSMDFDYPDVLTGMEVSDILDNSICEIVGDPLGPDVEILCHNCRQDRIEEEIEEEEDEL